MARYVALLRSVNVAGRRIAMADLRGWFEDMGYADVVTYIQTGNVLFSTRATRSHGSSRRPWTEPRLATAIEDRLAEQLGEAPAVIVRSTEELARIGTASPYARTGANPSRHHVTFLASAPSAAALSAFDLPPSGRDELVVDGKEVYVSTPDGYAETKYNGAFLERRLGVVSTTRNWNTVTKLCELAAP